MNDLIILTMLATFGLAVPFFRTLQCTDNIVKFSAIVVLLILPFAALLTFEPKNNMGGFNYAIYVHAAKLSMHADPYARASVPENFLLTGPDEYLNPIYTDYPASQVWVHAKLLQLENALREASGLKSWKTVFDFLGFRVYFLSHFLISIGLSVYLIRYAGGSKKDALVAAALVFSFFILSYNICYEMKIQVLSSCLLTLWATLKAQKRPIYYLIIGLWAAHFGITVLFVLILFVLLALPKLTFTGVNSFQIKWLPAFLMFLGVVLPFAIFYPSSFVPWAMRAQRLGLYGQPQFQSIFFFMKDNFSMLVLNGFQVAFVLVTLLRFSKLKADLGMLIFCSACISLWVLPEYNWNRLPGLICLGFIFGSGNKTIEYWLIFLVLVAFSLMPFFESNNLPYSRLTQVIIANILPVYYLASLWTSGSRFPAFKLLLQLPTEQATKRPNEGQPIIA